MIRAFVFSLCMSLSLPVVSGPIIDGTEWLQPNLFIGLTWNSINSICPSDGTACSGVLNGIDVTGYEWADVDDVNALFNSFIGSPFPMGPGPAIHSAAGAAATWAPAFMAVFDPTMDFGGLIAVSGWTASTTSQGTAYLGRIFDNPTIDQADTSQVRGKDVVIGQADAFPGVWLYRTADDNGSVPAPPTLFLLICGLVAITFGRRREPVQS